MGCKPFSWTAPDGSTVTGIACSRGRSRPRERCRWCTAPGTLLCDGPVGSGTCDKPLCAQHAIEVGPDRHLCPACAKTCAIAKDAAACSP